MIRNSITKIVCLLIIIGLNWTGLSAIIDTFAYFSDAVISSGNTFTAGTLDFELDADDWTPAENAVNLLPGQSVSREISVVKNGSLDFQYNARTEIDTENSDSAFCNALKLEVWLEGELKYSNGLVDFNLEDSPVVIGEDGQDDWNFKVTLPGDVPEELQGKSCQFKFIFEAWQTNLPDSSSGFTDEEKLENTIKVGYWNPPVVLNEFLPRPNGPLYDDVGNLVFDFGDDHDDMPQGEWVELYNNGDTAVDVTGWYLRDSTPGEGNKTSINTDHILTASPTVPAHGWLVVYMNKPIYNNTGDTVRLFDSRDTLIDSYSYGTDPDYCEQTPTPSDKNAGDGSGIPPCSPGKLIPGNKSYARIPDGIGDWFDPIPTPGRKNVLEDENVIFEPLIAEPDGIDENIDESTTTTETNPVEELIIIDGLFLASPNVDFSDFQPEEEPTSTEEVIDEEINTDIDAIEETTDEQSPITDEQMPTGESSIDEETDDSEDTPVVDQIIEEVPAIEEQPVVVPENPESNDSNPESSGDASTNEGGGDTTETPAE